MISAILLCALSTNALPQAAESATVADAVSWSLQDEDPKEEYKKKKKEAGKDPEKLWDLYTWCEAYGLAKEGRSALRALIKVVPNHKEARALLGHVLYDGKWFTTEKKLAKYKHAEELRKAEEEGLVKWKDEWVPQDDLPYLERGMMRDDNGEWVDAEEYQRIQDGWRKQDTVWISPDEFEQMDKGLWKCGSKWLELEAANKYHQQIDKPWIIPGDYYTLHSTCDRSVSEGALETIENAFRDLVRIYGRSPEFPVNVMLLRDATQYGSFAAGNDLTGRPAVEVAGWSSLHWAFFAELWITDDKGFMAAGVGYWDASSESGNAFGPHSARHAAGLSFSEAIDPSPKTLKKLLGGKQMSAESFFRAFYDEKQLPMWFRYAAASYTDRYFIDTTTGAGGDPLRFRKWSVDNLRSKGGLRSLRDLWGEGLNLEKFENSQRLLNEWGLIMAFILDGKCKPVVDKHAELKHALKNKLDTRKLVRDLQKELEKHETDIRKFAEL